jgi:hypothetical protein
MRKLLYADYLITFLIIIIWSQLFIGFHIVLEFISFAVMCYLIWVKSNWLLKCPKCNEHIFNTLKATGIRTSEVHVVTAARSLNSAYNKSFKRTNNSWLFAPSSPILANYYLPLNEALYAREISE